MKKIVSTLLTFALVFGMCAASMGQTATPGINNRERRQQKRIRKGVRSGELTKKEAVRLEAQQARTRAAEASAKADGKVTAKERVRLQKRENRTSRTIYRQKHDQQTRKH